jgi:hypothetical protein
MSRCALAWAALIVEGWELVRPMTDRDYAGASGVGARWYDSSLEEIGGEISGVLAGHFTSTVAVRS